MHTQHHVHEDEYSPLYIASQKGHDKTVEMLLQAGATVDLQSKVVTIQNGDTALDKNTLQTELHI